MPNVQMPDGAIVDMPDKVPPDMLLRLKRLSASKDTWGGDKPVGSMEPTFGGVTEELLKGMSNPLNAMGGFEKLERMFGGRVQEEATGMGASPQVAGVMGTAAQVLPDVAMMGDLLTKQGVKAAAKGIESIPEVVEKAYRGAGDLLGRATTGVSDMFGTLTGKGAAKVGQQAESSSESLRRAGYAGARDTQEKINQEFTRLSTQAQSELSRLSDQAKAELGRVMSQTLEKEKGVAAKATTEQQALQAKSQAEIDGLSQQTKAELQAAKTRMEKEVASHADIAAAKTKVLHKLQAEQEAKARVGKGEFLGPEYEKTTIGEEASSQATQKKSELENLREANKNEARNEWTRVAHAKERSGEFVENTSKLKELKDEIAELTSKGQATGAAQITDPNSLRQLKSVEAMIDGLDVDTAAALEKAQIPPPPVKPKTRSLLQELKNAGVVESSVLRDATGMGKKEAAQSHIGLGRKAKQRFSEGGRQIDGVAEWMQQNGWISRADVEGSVDGGASVAREKLLEATNGTAIHPSDESAVFQHASEEKYWDESFGQKAEGISKQEKLPASAAALEDIARKLDEVSRGGKVQGYDAIEKIQAGKMAKKIHEAIGEFLPGVGEKGEGGYANYRKLYAQDSEKLDPFKEGVGKSLTKERISKSSLPSEIFSDAGSLHEFQKITGTDAVDLAKNFASKELKGAKTSAQVQAWADKHSDWLSDPSVAQVKEQVEKFASKLAHDEKIGKMVSMERNEKGTSGRIVESEANAKAAKETGEKEIQTIKTKGEKSLVSAKEDADKALESLKTKHANELTKAKEGSEKEINDTINRHEKEINVAQKAVDEAGAAHAKQAAEYQTMITHINDPHIPHEKISSEAHKIAERMRKDGFLNEDQYYAMTKKMEETRQLFERHAEMKAKTELYRKRMMTTIYAAIGGGVGAKLGYQAISSGH